MEVYRLITTRERCRFAVKSTCDLEVNVNTVKYCEKDDTVLYNDPFDLGSSAEESNLTFLFLKNSIKRKKMSELKLSFNHFTENCVRSSC